MRGILEPNLAMKAMILPAEVGNIGEEWCEKAVCKVLGSIVRASIYTQRRSVLFVKNATELFEQYSRTHSRTWSYIQCMRGTGSIRASQYP